MFWCDISCESVYFEYIKKLVNQQTMAENLGQVARQGLGLVCVLYVVQQTGENKARDFKFYLRDKLT